MTNAEKFKTAKEREEAYRKFCQKFQQCEECPAYKRSNEQLNWCRFDWLELEAEEEKMTATEVAVILAEHNKWRRGEDEYADPGVGCPHTPKELSKAIDRAVEILRSVKE